MLGYIIDRGGLIMDDYSELWDIMIIKESPHEWWMKLLVHFHAIRKLGSSPIGGEDFLCSQTLRWLMEKRVSV
jgi:hypothetical protein